MIEPALDGRRAERAENGAGPARGREQRSVELVNRLDGKVHLRQADLGEGRDSPQTVETSFVVIMASMAGLLAPVPGRGGLVACPLFLLPGAAVVSGVEGGPPGRRRRAMRSTLEAGGAAPYP